MPLGLLIGLPALRMRGVNLAVVTLAFAFTIDALVFNWTGFTGGLGGRNVDSPTLFGLNLGIANGHSYPRDHLRCARPADHLPGGLARRPAAPRAGGADDDRGPLQRARGGRGRHRRRAHEALAFALSAFIAGLAGCLYAYSAQNVSPAAFTRSTR